MKKNISMVAGIIVLCSIFMFSSCKKAHTFSQEYIFEEDTWCADNHVALTFEIPESAVGKNFDMYVEFDYTPEIRRKMMKMDITTISPIDERSVEYLIFFKDSEGRFRGKAEGNLLRFDMLLRNHFIFRKAGTWTIELIQRSELFYFEGVKKLRIVFKEAAEKEKEVKKK